MVKFMTNIVNFNNHAVVSTIDSTIESQCGKNRLHNDQVCLYNLELLKMHATRFPHNKVALLTC